MDFELALSWVIGYEELCSHKQEKMILTMDNDRYFSSSNHNGFQKTWSSIQMGSIRL